MGPNVLVVLSIIFHVLPSFPNPTSNDRTQKVRFNPPRTAKPEMKTIVAETRINTIRGKQKAASKY